MKTIQNQEFTTTRIIDQIRRILDEESLNTHPNFEEALALHEIVIVEELHDGTVNRIVTLGNYIRNYGAREAVKVLCKELSTSQFGQVAWVSTRAWPMSRLKSQPGYEVWVAHEVPEVPQVTEATPEAEEETINPQTLEAAKESLGSSSLGLIGLLRTNPHITTSELSQILKVSTATIKRKLAVLQQLGRLSRSGNSRNGSWVISGIEGAV